MDYNETVDYLYQQIPEYQRIGHAAYKEGIENSLALDRIFNHPHRKYRTIHVGGTNGKGSVSHLLAAILHQSGYRVGLYSSPHLLEFRERIKVNGEMIDKQFVIQFVEKYRELFEPVMPSFFELSMEMAFLWFAEQEVDIAVVEVGLGGRLDSTNIISPDLSIITNIGFDHMNYLGEKLPKIAAEKAGIIKPFTPVVIGEAGEEPAIAELFKEKAESLNAPILFAESYIKNFISERNSGALLFQGGQFQELQGELGGPARDKNAKTVLTAIDLLLGIGYKIPEKAVYNGFANVVSLTGLMGRWQTLQSDPKIICDIAHNADGIKYLIEQLAIEDYKNLHILFGVADDKDIEAIIKLLPKNSSYYFTKASVKRAVDENIVAEYARSCGLKGKSYPTPAEALAAAKVDAGKDDLIFIGGSSFIVADILTLYF